MTAADHANTVREAIWGYGKPPFDREAALAALDALVAQAEAPEALNLPRYAEDLDAEFAARDAERDEWKARAEAAEAEREQLRRELLRAIDDTNDVRADRDRLADALRRVLANAESWHGSEGLETGHARALTVIAEWCRAALARTENTP